MAAPAPARALRSVLQASARPAFSSPALYARSSPLLAAAAPFARRPQLLVPSVPSLLRRQQQRGFASSVPAAGWLSWGGQKKEELKEQAAEAKELVEDKAAQLATAAEEKVKAVEEAVTPAATEPTIVATAPADLSTANPDATAALEGNYYDGIFTGSLDLSSLAGAWGPHPIMRLQSLFLHLHEQFPLLGHGLTWAVLIPVVTVFLRLALFPFQARAQSNAARMAIIQPQMLQGMNKLKEAKARGDFAAMQASQIEVQTLMRENNVNPIKNLVFPLAQAAVFTCMFFALRGLANAGLPSMATEGFGWVQDLTERDPYWVLPVLSTGLTLATLETGVDSSTQVQTSTTKTMKGVFRAILVCALPFIAYFPAALLVYWVANNSLSLLQATLLKQPAVRKLLGIPIPPPKPQPGDPNYVPEPSFMEAFRNVQTDTLAKMEEGAKNKAARNEIAEKFANRANETASVYTPRKPLARPVKGVSRAAQELLEQASTPAPRVIEAQPVSAQEAERNRRVAEARRRRMGRK
ncbi:hypothetical protein JCM10213_009011 [Rhodosporidiobolus nylandii]